MKPALNKHELQFDYFSDNYQQFEYDFYRLATTATPLVFLEDDLLRSMSTGQRNYFRLHHTQSRDHRDHYFHFRVSTHDSQPHVKEITHNRIQSNLLEKLVGKYEKSL